MRTERGERRTKLPSLHLRTSRRGRRRWSPPAVIDVRRGASCSIAHPFPANNTIDSVVAARLHVSSEVLTAGPADDVERGGRR